MIDGDGALDGWGDPLCQRVLDVSTGVYNGRP